MAGYRGSGIHPVDNHRHEDVFRPVSTPRSEHDRFKRHTIQSGYRSLPIDVGRGTAGNGGFGRPLRRMYWAAARWYWPQPASSYRNCRHSGD